MCTPHPEYEVNFLINPFSDNFSLCQGDIKLSGHAVSVLSRCFQSLESKLGRGRAETGWSAQGDGCV